jgi:hypothetical protein
VGAFGVLRSPDLKGPQIMGAFEAFVRDNPALAERSMARRWWRCLGRRSRATRKEPMGTVAMHDYRVFFRSGGVMPLPNRKRTKGKARSQANCARHSAASIRDDQASQGG